LDFLKGLLNKRLRVDAVICHLEQMVALKITFLMDLVSDLFNLFNHQKWWLRDF
jgi:hypothetical protein